MNETITFFQSYKSENINFTRREAECFKLVATEGLSIKEVGRVLDIGWRTAETHLINIKKKLGCKKLSQLVQRYYQLNP